MNGDTCPELHPDLIAIYQRSIEECTALIQKFRIAEQPDVVAKLYEAADLLDSIDIHDPELTPLDLEATAKAVSEIYQSIQTRFFP